MNLRVVICLLSLLFFVSVSLPVLPTNSDAAAQSSKPRYNVLFIASDDLRPELGVYGNPIIKTPNIDKLAARGVRFDRAYAQYSLCNPSRTSLLTGRYPSTTGVLDNETWFRALHPDFVSLPQHFKENGYATLRSGKIYHGGMDDTDAWTEGGEPRNFTGARRPRPPASVGGRSRAAHSDRFGILKGEGEEHGDYRHASRAIKYLETYRDKPFFLALGFSKPHTPLEAPQRFFDLYKVEQMQLPPDFAPTPAAPAGFPEISIPRRNADLFIGREASPTEAGEMIRAYYASVSYIDTQVGRVLDALDRLGLRDNTIVVFWGDHGFHLGEKGKWSKAYSLFEVGTRVPLIIAFPGAKGQVSAGTVQLLDMFPTLVELCGLKQPAGLEGRSLAPLLKNPGAKWEYPAFAETLYQGKHGRSVHNERWHYAEWDEGRAGAMLFDLASDPRELKNLAADPAHAKRVQEMKELLKRLPPRATQPSLSATEPQQERQKVPD
ncbi:MAG TPA: sulfatase [Pyrinomonadaceae bacterium]|nr:sulfatase [Pyrinomonadaceae bacterium]